ncbi:MULTISPECIES: hypothetical protein [unclassified Nonlabens]|uniref:hypothetical protein n=1 Tax=unclassified Nonlabens TaxID=2615035 RepID=UPI003870D79E
MKASITLIIILFTLSNSNAQVGIGTTNPSVGTTLHIDDSSGDKGVKFADVNIIDLNTVAPLPLGTEIGTMVYNTNPFTGEGFFYWNGFLWAPNQLFEKRAAKFEHAKTVENVPEVSLSKEITTGGVDAELMDHTIFNEANSLFIPVTDTDNRVNSLQINKDGRYRISVFISLEQDDSSISVGSTAILARIKITDSSNSITYDGGTHRSTEMDRNGTGDDDGTLNFTEVIELHQGDTIAINCIKAEGTSAVYQRASHQSAFIIEKLR